MRKFITVCFLLILSTLLGCTRGQAIGTSVPAAFTSPTSGGLAPVPLQTILPAVDDEIPALVVTETLTPSPVQPTIDPTYFNFPTLTPTPTIDPSQILLRIVSPGPMSKVISPIEFIVHIAPGYTGVSLIELIGEDGRPIYQNSFKTYSNIGYYTRLVDRVKFEIKGVAEIARLQISTSDSKGHMLALNSVRLLLQTIGENEFSPPYSLQDRVLLRYPQEDDEFYGSALPVTGEYQALNDLPVVLELIDADGKVLGSRQLQLGPVDGKYEQFTTSVPYQVTRKTQARLVIRQQDDRIAGLAYFYSLPIQIGP